MFTNTSSDILIYISGGLLGDFIQQLSVINEIYLSIGKKGLLYISNNNGDNFRLGLEKAYNDLKEIVLSQEYIQDFKIYNNESYDIDLSAWRKSSLIYKANWYQIMKDVYRVEWGKHQWLNLSKNPEYKDIIFISLSNKSRFNPAFDYNWLKQLKRKIYYLGQDISEYNKFISLTNFNCDNVIITNNLLEFSEFINSCYLFVGVLSSPMAIAHSLHKNRLILLSNSIDDIHLFNLDLIIPNMKLYLNDRIFPLKPDESIIKMSRSQFGQDRHLIDVIYKGRRNGFFIELGAQDGYLASNSYILEKEYGWNGLCLEPNPRYHQRLREIRNCHISFFAAYSENDKEFDFIDAEGMSGFEITNSHNNILHNPRFKVKTKTLTYLLDEINAPTFIDYLSLDVEGAELDVLKGIDFNKYKIGYMCVEHNNIEKNRREVRNFLENKGYSFYRQNNVDDDFILMPTSSGQITPILSNIEVGSFQECLNKGNYSGAYEIIKFLKYKGTSDMDLIQKSILCIYYLSSHHNMDTDIVDLIARKIKDNNQDLITYIKLNKSNFLFYPNLVNLVKDL